MYPKISLKAARVNAGLSQAEAARRLKISKETLANYEKGKTSPDWTTVKKIEEQYSISADYIFFG